MDFDTVLKLILNGFQEKDVRYAVIGGFALGLLGVPRATVDLDFLVHRGDLSKIDAIMKTNGYECVYKTENVSQYVSPLKLFGEIDFLHAFRSISCKMIDQSVEKEIFEGKLKIRVLTPENVIGLKVQAIANDKKRELREYADIEALMEHHGINLDWQLLGEYFSMFKLTDRFNELEKKYGKVN
ncbi:MAG: nucleotidyltransferase [Candidatus Aureabacteria bacterium]|nr:nucleotidyltransferase [Candidatus Auribacterota bacterium]